MPHPATTLQTKRPKKSGPNLWGRIRTTLAKLAGRLAGPLPEGPAEVREVRIAQLVGNLADRLVGIPEQLDRPVFQHRFDTKLEVVKTPSIGSVMDVASRIRRWEAIVAALKNRYEEGINEVLKSAGLIGMMP